MAAFLVVGGCSAVVATVGVKAFHEFDGVRTTTNDFFQAVERGDGAAAQDLACDETLAGTIRNELDAGIVAHHISGVSVQRSGFGESTEQGATVTASVTLASGVHQEQHLFLRREREKWRVCIVSPPLLR